MMIIDDKNKCNCGAYWNDNGYCSNGHVKEQEEIFKEMMKEFDEKLDKYKKYTHEELSKFEKEGISGEVCFCNVNVANTMTIECVNCGKVQSQYAKRFVREKND